jgi:hypothetical protein
MVFIVQAYQTSWYVVLHGGIFLGKWHRSFAGSSDCKMNVLSAYALNTQYKDGFVFLVLLLVAALLFGHFYHMAPKVKKSDFC